MPLTEEEKFDRMIERELKVITDKDIRTYNTINSDIKMVVTKLFQKYPEKFYPKNTSESKKAILDELAERKYEWVADINDLHRRDGVYAVDGRDFWNIKLTYLGRLNNYCSRRDMLFFKTNKEKRVKPHDRLLLFRKLTNKEKFRILLIETLTEN